MTGTEPNFGEPFFTGLVLEFWRGVATPETTRMEVAFLRRVLDVQPPAVLLDLACGYGRHALLLAEQRYRVVGVDISEELIAEADAAAAARGLDCRFTRSDMRRFCAEQPYDGAYCLGSSFGHLSHEDTLEFLATIARALKPGAHFVLDSGAVAETVLPGYRKRLEMKAGGVEMTAVNHYDATAGVMHTDYEFRRGNIVETRTRTQSMHTAAELRRMLGQAGLEFVTAFGSAAGAPFILGSERMLLVTRR